MVQRIPLSGRKGAGRYALVDDADVPAVDGLTWWLQAARKGGGSTVDYAVTRLRGSGSPGKYMRMHVLLTGRRGTDHVNGDGLDNQRSNLRAATRQQNGANQKVRSGGTSRYKGVSWNAQCAAWQAHIKVNRRSRYLGLHVSEVAAARAYDVAAQEAWGAFARLNFAPGHLTRLGVGSGPGLSGSVHHQLVNTAGP